MADIAVDDLPPLTVADVIAAFDLNDAGEMSLETWVSPAAAQPVSIFAVASAPEVEFDMPTPQYQVVADLLNMMDSPMADLDAGYDAGDHGVDTHHDHQFDDAVM